MLDVRRFILHSSPVARDGWPGVEARNLTIEMSENTSALGATYRVPSKAQIAVMIVSMHYHAHIGRLAVVYNGGLFPVDEVKHGVGEDSAVFTTVGHYVAFELHCSDWSRLVRMQSSFSAPWAAVEFPMERGEA